MESNTLLVDYSLNTRRTDTIADFIVKNHDLYHEVIADIQRFRSIRLYCWVKNNSFMVDENTVAYSILVNAESFVINALSLARERSNIESAVLLRSAIEHISTALNIGTDSDAMVKFIKDDYASSKMVGRAKKHIKLLPEIWGALSTVAVHTNIYAHGPESMTVFDDKIHVTVNEEFELLKWVGKRDEKSLQLVSIVAIALLRAFEIIFLKRAKMHDLNGYSCSDRSFFLSGVSTEDLLSERVSKFKSIERDL